MKIRIKGNSVRYRLTKTEVETFYREGSFREVTDFGDTIFTYILKAKKGINALEASFTDNTITLFLPDGERENWATSDRVGYQNEMELPNGKRLDLLLEKDFVCLDNTVEDQSDNYPNPRAEGTDS